MHGKEKTQKEIAEALISTLRQGGVVLFAQAIKPLAPGGDKRPFQEILTRFREEEEKLLPPGTAFPILEEFHLVPYVDRWVVSCLAKWIGAKRSLKPDWVSPRNSINLSSDTLDDPGFAEYTAKSIQKSQLPAGTFTFEVSWDTAILNTEPLRKLMTQLKPAGCSFTIAGFDGSEQSFGFVKSLKPDFVKLSYGIVKNIDHAIADAEKAESINSKCRELGIKTIAEYVESNSVLEHLAGVEVDYAQGLAISSPQAIDMSLPQGNPAPPQERGT